MKNSMTISLLLFILTFVGDLSSGEIEENNNLFWDNPELQEEQMAL